ncbi:MAG: hypothetical protein KGM91_26530, partial [Burkholderiales bacterium]|nr:hypothetical protein [Burkholderiales bacterium]
SSSVYRLHPSGECAKQLQVRASAEEIGNFAASTAGLRFNPKYGSGEDSFAAMQRLVDRLDPGYRA